jgi:hypothetical protein
LYDFDAQVRKLSSTGKQVANVVACRRKGTCLSRLETALKS